MAELPLKPAERTDETIKETIESIVIAFILAFVFRAYVVEAFVIPTGSMAPTLLGAHVRVTCPQCGYHFTLDPPDRPKTAVSHGRINRKLEAVCPMCHEPVTIPRGTRVGAGDRILVHKFIYSYSNPRRWDVVVFKEPKDPQINFIKRLVGLPDEQLHIFEGNIYTRPTDDSGKLIGDGQWRIARKGPRELVQRAVWRPIYHSRFVPLDGGEASLARGATGWTVPWQADQPDHWRLKERRSYDFTGQDAGVGERGGSSGRIRFHFEGIDGKPVHGRYPSHLAYPYNQVEPARGLTEPIEDVRVAATIQPHEAGVGVALSTTARLNNPELTSHPNGTERLIATLHDDGELTLEAADLKTGQRRLLKKTQVPALTREENTALELWYVDQQASVWIGGERVLAWAYHLPLNALIKRPPMKPTPRIAIQVIGGPATLHHVQVDRDLFYSIHNPLTGPARGALERHGRNNILHLGADQFFCLGDNGPRSYDGRYWDAANPWIVRKMLKQRLKQHETPYGVVPRDLMMGRAFFVYFPDPYKASYIPLPLPNFGDMRFIH